MTILNMIWPAIYVVEELYHFWYIVFFTIVIEMFLLKWILKVKYSKALLMSVLGNLISGVVGTYIMMWSMLFWHILVGQIFGSIFNAFNWIMTFVLLFTGSVFLEVAFIVYWFEYKVKPVLKSMLLGNALSYVMIAILMLSAHRKSDGKTVSGEVISFHPSKSHFVLLDSSWMKIQSSELEISKFNMDKTVNTTYAFKIKFDTEYPDKFRFQFRLVGNKYAGGMSEREKVFLVAKYTDTIKVLLEQKNPDSSIGWTMPVITDTIVFVRQQSNEAELVNNMDNTSQLEYKITLLDSVVKFGEKVKLNVEISNPGIKDKVILFTGPDKNSPYPFATKVILEPLDSKEKIDYDHVAYYASNVYTDDELENSYDTIKSNQRLVKQFDLYDIINLNTFKKVLPKGNYSVQMEINHNLTNSVILHIK